MLEPGHCRFTGIHKVVTLLLSVRKCGSWEGCKKSEIAQIYKPLAIRDHGKFGHFQLVVKVKDSSTFKYC